LIGNVRVVREDLRELPKQKPEVASQGSYMYLDGAAARAILGKMRRD
jgi:hypothetical protein